MEEKKEVNSKKKILLLVGILIFIEFSFFVFAATTMNLPITNGNYSSSLIINLTVDANGMNNMTNVTCFYNSSGGAATVFLTTILNESVSDLDFTNSTISTLSLTDATTYNISCFISNSSTLNSTKSVSGVTIDHTAPSVTFSCSPSLSIDEGTSLTCTCIGIDTIGPNTTTITNPPTSNSGDFPLTCSVSDNLGNTNTTSLTYHVRQVITPVSPSSSTTTSTTSSSTVPNSSVNTTITNTTTSTSNTNTTTSEQQSAVTTTNKFLGLPYLAWIIIAVVLIIITGGIFLRKKRK
jgi:hypothetical protein